MPFTYLAGDIGGTNARINLYKVPEQGDEELICEAIYRSKDFNSLSGAIRHFLKEHNISEAPNSACFSVAGPVKNGSGWVFTEKEMQNELGIQKVVLLNDFAACGYGIKLLRPDDLYEISNNKKIDEFGPKVIIGAGTGLGEGNIFQTNEEFVVVPGEGGHTDFSPRNKIEFDLMLFIKQHLKLGRVGVERVVSGPGLENIYWFFAHENPDLVNTDISEQIRQSETPGKIISSLAISKKDIICEKSLKLFISCYGAEAGNMALNILPSGGVYVAGGIAPQLRDVIKEDFLESFYDKGRMRSILSTFPIFIVTNTSIGILGARYMARLKISEFDSKISRNMSQGDISRMAREYELLSRVPPPEFNPDAHSYYPSTPRYGSANLLLHEEHGRSARGYAELGGNLLWMGLGVGLSALFVGAFLFGQRSRK